MPILENEVSKISNSTCFATFDFSNGYCLHTLRTESQSSQSSIIPDGIFTPTIVLHGTANAATHLQSTLALVIPKQLVDSLLQWLDDVLAHIPRISRLIYVIEADLKICEE